jgi:hypothetical protein
MGMARHSVLRPVHDSVWNMWPFLWNWVSTLEVTSLLFVSTVGYKVVDVIVVSNCSGKNPQNPLPSLNVGNELHCQGIICSQHTHLVSDSLLVTIVCSKNQNRGVSSM